jgi:transcriptional regulator with XRE-family HTH domain
MTYPPYMREKARKLRAEQNLTIDEIAERLGVSRTTIYFWVGDMPRPKRCLARRGPGHAMGNEAMQRKYKRLRDEAFELGKWEFRRLERLPTFRDFVCLYIGEGYKRNRNTVQVANSDSAAMRLAVYWLSEFSTKRVQFSIQYHADQRPKTLQQYWSHELGIPDLTLVLLRKSNSGQLAHRTWRSKYGVLSVRIYDTLLRARLQGWIDRMRGEWLDSPAPGA